ncbi:MAG: T9SS type A sorting domain-containing protein [Bacteroidota bacterium]
MKFIHPLLIRTVFFMAFSIVLLSHEPAFSQTGIIVEPGENTIIDAMNAYPGDTLILQKGREYVINQPIEITVPIVIRGEAYSLDDADPPAVIRGNPAPGQEGVFYMILVAADLTLIDIGFIGFTNDNKQIEATIGVTKGYLNIEVSGCVVQGCSRWIETHNFPGTHFLLRNNIHFNTSTTYWCSWGCGFVGPFYKGDSIITESYNNTVFVGGENMSSAGTGPNGSQFIDHNTYVNTWGMTFHKCKDKDFSLKNCIMFNTFLRGYVGERMWIDGSDTLTWGGDYISYEFGDTLNGDFAILPHLLDSVDVPGVTREVTVTNNLQYNEQRVLDWNEANNVTTQPFVTWPVEDFAVQYGWTIEDNFMDQDGTSFDPQFAMGEIPIGALEKSWEQRLGRMDPMLPDIEIAWRPDIAEPKDFIWPLPFDFTPTNEAILNAGDDGYPLGDLNWFGKDVVKAWENGWPMPVIERAGESLELSLANYPNPFSALTTISYHLPVGRDVTVKIYNVTGAEVATLADEHQMAGRHEIMFDAANLSEGIYFCKIQAGNLSQHQKMSLIR